MAPRISTGLGLGLAVALVLLLGTVGLVYHATRVLAAGDAALIVVLLSLAGAVALAGLAFALVRYSREEARAARQARRLSETQYRDLVEQVKDYAIFRTDPEGYTVSWNEGVERVLGYTEPEFVGLSAEAIFTPEDAAADLPRRELEQAAQSGTANNDRWMMRKDGTRFFAAGITTALRDADQRLLGFTKVMRDQTAWKTTEEALRHSETRYRLVARASREAVWDWDIVADEVRYNDAIETLFGYRVGEVIPSAWWYERVHPEDRDRVSESISEAIEGDAEFWTENYRFLRPDGSYAEVSDRGLIARDESGRAHRMLGTMADVTDRRRTEEKLVQAQRMEAVGRLASGIAHDLNNMLTAIVGYSTFVEQDLPGDAPVRADLREIRRAGDRAASLTRSLLAFSRREAIQPQALDLNGVIRDLERMLRPALGESITIETELAPGDATVLADRARLEQVILNLALNARDAMPEGGRLTIGTTLVTMGPDDAARHPGVSISHGRYVRMVVTDTGLGMDRETLARAFQPFFTTKAAGEGTGLGLATVYGTVKQAGGFAWAYSEPDHGTTFSIYLPVTSAAAQSERLSGEMPGFPARGSETVLVVEDEPTVRTLACRTLEMEGYRCLRAGSAAEALESLDRFDGPVHLMLTDLVMPGMSGARLAEWVKRRRPEMCVVFTSGFAHDDVIRRGLVEAQRPFLQKPWSPRQLIQCVRDVLDGAAREAAASRA